MPQCTRVLLSDTILLHVKTRRRKANTETTEHLISIQRVLTNEPRTTSNLADYLAGKLLTTPSVVLTPVLRRLAMFGFDNAIPGFPR